MMSASQGLLSLQLVSTQSPNQILEGLRIWQDLGLLASRESRLQIRIKRTEEPGMQLTLDTDMNQSQILAGLDSWLAMGLLEHSTIACEIQVSDRHPQLLTGLDHWLNLQLLTSAEIQRLVQTYLTCRIPEPIRQPTPTIIPVFQEEYEPAVIPQRPRESREPSKAQQVAQSLLENTIKKMIQWSCGFRQNFHKPFFKRGKTFNPCFNFCHCGFGEFNPRTINGFYQLDNGIMAFKGKSSSEIKYSFDAIK